VERSKFKKSEKMMRKDVSAGEEVQNQNIRKNDKKRRFRRSKVKVQKIQKKT
jgi:threonyl-tRNA synthetase